MGKMIVIILRLIAYAYYFLPRYLQLKLGNALGWLLYFSGYRSRVIQENLVRAFPDQPAKQKEVFQKFHFHLGNLFLEILLVFGPMKSFVKRYVEVIGAEHIQEAQKKGKGIILQANHLGNWEVSGATLFPYLEQEVLMVTKLLKPKWLHDAFEAGRLRCGVKATYEPKTMKDALRHLKNNGAVGVVSDQYLGPPVGVRIPFFGVPVGTSTLAAILAKRTGAQVISVFCYRKSDGRFVVELSTSMEWENYSGQSHYEIVKNTQNYTQFVEQCVYQCPEQWLWTHKRFKGDLSPLKEDEWMQPRVRK